MRVKPTLFNTPNTRQNKGGNIKKAFEFRDDFIQKVGKENVFVSEVGPGLGAHTGPGAMVIAIQTLFDSLNDQSLDHIHSGFISKLSPQGTNLLASSFFGSIGKDESFFVDIDKDDDVYIYGQNANSISITPGCYGVANSAQFIAKFNPDLTNIQWQTTFSMEIFN